MKTIQAKAHYSDAECADMAGVFLGEDAYDSVLTEDADVLKPDGSFLLRFRKRAVPDKLYLDCLPAIRKAAQWTNNRGIASGMNERDGGGYDVVRSGIIGSFDRQGGRFPFCRLTSYNLDNPAMFNSIKPLAIAIDNQFKELMPERHAAQMSCVENTHEEWVINDTAFTTITVNKNFQTAVHQDAGDLKAGFGVMASHTSDNYDGAYTIFPKYRVAYDLRIGDVVMADVHEWHGNSPFVRHRGTGAMERISMVFYYRERMHQCGSTQEEVDRAKNLYGKIEQE